jgi:Domain of unknown function (DUF4884)
MKKVLTFLCGTQAVFTQILVVFATFIALQSCVVQRPVSTKTASNNKDYNVSFLFEHDGCKVYRFNDRGEFIYFTSCNGETSKAHADTSGIRRMQSINRNTP